MVIHQDIYLRTLKCIVELVKERLPLLAARRLASGRAWRTASTRASGLLRPRGREPPKRCDSASDLWGCASADTLILSRLGDRLVDIPAQLREEGLDLISAYINSI